MLTIEWAEPAAASLERLTPATVQRIISRVEWMAEHFGEVRSEALTGKFAGLLKLRVGDYRVVYAVDRTEARLTVREIGHRSVVCK